MEFLLGMIRVCDAMCPPSVGLKKMVKDDYAAFPAYLYSGRDPISSAFAPLRIVTRSGIRLWEILLPQEIQICCAPTAARACGSVLPRFEYGKHMHGNMFGMRRYVNVVL